jgi:hypothetical protein
MTHLKYAHFAPPPIFSEVYREGLFPDKLQARSEACAFTKNKEDPVGDVRKIGEVRAPPMMKTLRYGFPSDTPNKGNFQSRLKL